MTINNILIRKAEKSDLNDILKVEEQAFGYKKEALLVAGLLKDRSAEPILSLLAFYKGKAVGHVLFTRAYLDGRDQPMIHILAPLAVIPEFQKKGIGGLLIKRGLEILKETGTKLVFVLGHMDYYPRFGFIPDAKRLGFSAPYPIPQKFANAWMMQSLVPDARNIYNGHIQCANELNKPEHWRE
ncbi:MAG: N-acetyltransferase [Prolixibacteraceae bacterium]|nr:N-acetyltransferase [Prolixibacteraceae bacterium]